ARPFKFASLPFSLYAQLFQSGLSLLELSSLVTAVQLSAVFLRLAQTRFQFPLVLGHFFKFRALDPVEFYHALIQFGFQFRQPLRATKTPIDTRWDVKMFPPALVQHLHGSLEG